MTKIKLSPIYLCEKFSVNPNFWGGLNLFLQTHIPVYKYSKYPPPPPEVQRMENKYKYKRLYICTGFHYLPILLHLQIRFLTQIQWFHFSWFHFFTKLHLKGGLCMTNLKTFNSKCLQRFFVDVGDFYIKCLLLRCFSSAYPRNSFTSFCQCFKTVFWQNLQIHFDKIFKFTLTKSSNSLWQNLQIHFGKIFKFTLTKSSNSL